MNIIFATILALLLGMIFGAVLAILGWFIMGKINDKKLKKNMPVEELAEQALNNKPTITEKEVAEDDRRRIEKIRQFEKLRRTDGKVQSASSFYSGKFEDERRSDLQVKSSGSDKLNIADNRQDKSDDFGAIRFY